MPAPARPLTPRPKPAYPRPSLVHDHAQLFREAVYEDGETYRRQDDEDDDLED